MVLNRVIKTCEIIQDFINTRIYGTEGLKRSYAFWMFPYTLLKSVILVCIIKKNTTIPAHLCEPPFAIFKCICNQCSEDLIAFFNRAEDIYMPPTGWVVFALTLILDHLWRCTTQCVPQKHAGMAVISIMLTKTELP